MDEDILVRNCGTCSFEDGNLLRGICPQPTIGYNAFIFMSLIEMIIKSQCSISDPCRRVPPPRDTSYYNTDKQDYDFIVVGGGVGGESWDIAFPKTNKQDFALCSHTPCR